MVAELCTRNQLRSTFVAVVSEGAPALELFNLHSEHMSQDYVFHQGVDAKTANQLLLTDLQSKFESCGKTMQQLGLPSPTHQSGEILRQCIMFPQEKQKSFSLNLVQKLNPEQKHFFNEITRKLQSKKGGAFFLDGAGGIQSIIINRH